MEGNILDTSDKLKYCRDVLLVELLTEGARRGKEEYGGSSERPEADRRCNEKDEKSLEYLRKAEVDALAAQLLVGGKAQDVKKRAQELEGTASDLKKEVSQLKEKDELQKSVPVIAQEVVVVARVQFQNALD